MSDTKSVPRTYELECYKAGCNWSRTYSEYAEELAAKVDAELHWVREHDGLIPDDARYGNEQCPECEDINGLNGTVSCSTCGHIPEKVRA